MSQPLVSRNHNEKGDPASAVPASLELKLAPRRQSHKHICETKVECKAEVVDHTSISCDIHVLHSGHAIDQERYQPEGNSCFLLDTMQEVNSSGNVPQS